jgi:hypothetical protein
MSEARGSSEVFDGARVSHVALSGCRQLYWVCLGQNAAMLAPTKNPAW